MNQFLRLPLLIILHAACFCFKLQAAAYVPVEAAGIQVFFANQSGYALDIFFQGPAGQVVKKIHPNEQVALGTAENIRSDISYNTSGAVVSNIARAHKVLREDILQEALKAGRSATDLEVVITVTARYTSYDASLALREPTSPQMSLDRRRNLHQPIEMAEFGRKIYWALINHNAQALAASKQHFVNVFGAEYAEGAMLEALVLYFYFIAHKLGHVFQEGTFVIYDQDSQLYAFLNRLEKKYARNASHFNGLAETENKPWLAITGSGHYGYDLIIPAIGKKTLLFNKLERNGTVFYLKPESYGTDQLTDLASHAGSFLYAQGRKVLPSLFGSDDVPEYSKERVPKSILAQYLAIIEALPETDADKSSLSRSAVVRGIQSMYKESQRLAVKYPSSVALQSFIQFLESKERANDPKFSHLDKRFGAEVILTPEEFSKFKNPIQSYETF